MCSQPSIHCKRLWWMVCICYIFHLVLIEFQVFPWCCLFFSSSSTYHNKNIFTLSVYRLAAYHFTKICFVFTSPLDFLEISLLIIFQQRLTFSKLRRIFAFFWLQHIMFLFWKIYALLSLHVVILSIVVSRYLLVI